VSSSPATPAITLLHETGAGEASWSSPGKCSPSIHSSAANASFGCERRRSIERRSNFRPNAPGMRRRNNSMTLAAKLMSMCVSACSVTAMRYPVWNLCGARRCFYFKRARSARGAESRPWLTEWLANKRLRTSRSLLRKLVLEHPYGLVICLENSV